MDQLKYSIDLDRHCLNHPYDILIIAYCEDGPDCYLCHSSDLSHAVEELKAYYDQHPGKCSGIETFHRQCHPTTTTTT